jgi:hypothetical protein
LFPICEDTHFYPFTQEKRHNIYHSVINMRPAYKNLKTSTNTASLQNAYTDTQEADFTAGSLSDIQKHYEFI